MATSLTPEEINTFIAEVFPSSYADAVTSELSIRFLRPARPETG